MAASASVRSICQTMSVRIARSRVDLEYKAGVDHSAIFVRHLAGDRIQIGLVRGVIRIQHGGRDDALPPKAPTFTPKQGQYLAFIYAYTRVLGRPPPKPTCRGASASARPPSIKWCSLWNEPG